jgi:hypothetical protein
LSSIGRTDARALADETAQPASDTRHEIVAMGPLDLLGAAAQPTKMMSFHEPLIDQPEHDVGRQRDHALLPQCRRAEQTIATKRLRNRAEPFDRQRLARRPLGNPDLERRRDDRLRLVAVDELVASIGQFVGAPEYPLRRFGIE